MSLFKREKKEEIKKEPSVSKTAKAGSSVKKTVTKKKSTEVNNKVEITKGKISYNVLMHPLMTEKINLQMSVNQYSFAVNPRSNKVEIKKAIQETYGVNPTKVRIMNVLGKSVRSGRGQSTHRTNWKKAIVTLPTGKKIDIYEG